MKVLWICNLILPEIAQELGLPYLPKEGWVEGLLSMVRENEQIEPVLAFPVPEEYDGKSGKINGLSYYGFYEDTQHPETYTTELESKISDILVACKPDLMHCFGTEYPHTLAACRAFGEPSKILISMQGLCTVVAQRYMANLPEYVQNGKTFRDVIRKDTLKLQQLKFEKRGQMEREAVALAGHIAGRTAYDKKHTGEWNDQAVYHHLGENLRDAFYEGEWNVENAQPHRIFVAQADYPLKGFHYLLHAVNKLRRKYADVEIYVAGQSLISGTDIKSRLKRTIYGKYLLYWIRKYRLTEIVHVLGRLSTEQMKEQYLKCNLFVLPSANDNSPNALGEAMMLGVPCVASDVGGISSVFTDREDGLLFPISLGDSDRLVGDNLADAISESWEYPKRTYAYAKNARAHAQQNHNREKNVAEILEIYKEMLKK